MSESSYDSYDAFSHHVCVTGYLARHVGETDYGYSGSLDNERILVPAPQTF